MKCAEATSRSSRLSNMIGWVVKPGVVLVATALIGCGARTEFGAEDLEINRSNWDSLSVGLSFVKRTTLGGTTRVYPDSVTVAVFDETFDSLYVGPPGSIPIPDRELGDRERVTIEACGELRARQICLQQEIRASAKRLHLEEEIDYPSDSDMARGSYDFTFRVERQEFGGDGWESIESGDVNGYLVAWVDDAEAERKGKVRVPFDRPRGEFNLSRHANYKNFRFFLDSKLLDQPSARVNFDVFAGLSSSPVYLASIPIEVGHKSEAERADQVRFFVEQAAERIIDELDSFLGGRGAVAYVREWNFHTFSRTYRIPMRVEWRGSIFDRGRYEVEGILEVRDDGSRAVFEYVDGNQRADRRWERRTDSRMLSLGRLDPDPDSEEVAPI